MKNFNFEKNEKFVYKKILAYNSCYNKLERKNEKGEDFYRGTKNLNQEKWKIGFFVGFLIKIGGKSEDFYKEIFQLNGVF